MVEKALAGFSKIRYHSSLEFHYFQEFESVVRIRMKRLGRKNRPFYRVCVVDGRRPRDGRVLEELGHYDPMCKEVDARAILRGERIDYWLGVGAQPSEACSVLIKKYGTNGTHLTQQAEALARLGRAPKKAAAVEEASAAS
jgi:small subunit ribosomal protein S16